MLTVSMTREVDTPMLYTKSTYMDYSLQLSFPAVISRLILLDA